MEDLLAKLMQGMEQNNPSSGFDLIDQLKRIKLQAALSGQSIAGNKGLAMGGRLGLGIPTDAGSFDVGVSGGGAYIPKQNVRDFAINRVDANYRSGKNSFGVDFDPQDPGHNFMLNYKRDF